MESASVVYAAVIVAVAIVAGFVLASLVLSAAVRRSSEHIAGFFGGDGSYDKAYMPWDELMKDIIDQNPEMYEESELELQHSHAVEGTDE